MNKTNFYCSSTPIAPPTKPLTYIDGWEVCSYATILSQLEMIISPNFHIVEVITPVLGHFGDFGFSIVLEHKRHMTTSGRPTANLERN
jgi:hypothetical protein